MEHKPRHNNQVVRLSQIQLCLHKYPAGLTTRELSEMCEAPIRTIQRDLLVLQSDLHIPIDKKSLDRYAILKDYILPPVAYSLYEGLVLFLAARLLIRQTDEGNPHTQSAISKLISMMPEPLAVQLRQSVDSIGKKSVNPDELNVFEKVSIAWVTRKRLRILYHSLHSGQQKEWYVNPYFVEMSGVGYSIYLIGYAESGEQMGIYTFKLNRIKEVEVLNESFQLPSELNLDKLLSSSWGVIWGDDVRVKLKFSPLVTRRVKESIWHPSQVIEDLPDGGCLLTIQVGSALEMTPWIRWWGSDVEVLEPETLRRDCKRWAQELFQMYNQS